MSVCGSRCFTTHVTALFKGFVYHYMDDTLLATGDPVALQNCFAFFCVFLLVNLVCIAADKVQTVPPWKYLRFLLFEQKFAPQPIVLQTSIKTPIDLQKLLGTLNWLRPTLGISTEELSHLFYLLKGDTDLLSPLLTSWMQKPLRHCNL